MRISILHTNDFHGTLSPAMAAFIRDAKSATEQPCLYFDSGDCIKAGNLAVPLRPEEAWPLLSEAGCDASVMGNRESHIVEAALRAKLNGVAHPLLAANVRTRKGDRPLPGTLEIMAGDMKVGVVGVMVPMVKESMVTSAASAYLWDLPIPTAVNLGTELRPKVDLLIALTHIGFAQDRELATTGTFDLILGGHSHTVLETPVHIGSTWICQGGSHGRFMGSYSWADGTLEGGLVDLPKA